MAEATLEGLMALPIIVVHRSNSSYLDICLRQAQRSNPDSRIILIGDEHNAHSKAEHYLYRDFAKASDAFSRVYEHLSLNPRAFELFCFARWFIIAEFMRVHAIDSAFAQDSDVLLFSDVTALERDYAATSLSFARNGGHIMFVIDRVALEHFCAYVIEAYTDKERLSSLRSIFAAYKLKHRAGGICDMTLLYHYSLAYPEVTGAIPTVSGSAVFDNNINALDGFTVCGSAKKIAFDGERPFGVRSDNGEKVYFHALHFQGEAKSMMRSVFERDSLAFNRDALKLGRTLRRRAAIVSVARKVPGLLALRRRLISALRKGA